MWWVFNVVFVFDDRQLYIYIHLLSKKWAVHVKRAGNICQNTTQFCKLHNHVQPMWQLHVSTSFRFWPIPICWIWAVELGLEVSEGIAGGLLPQWLTFLHTMYVHGRIDGRMEGWIDSIEPEEVLISACDPTLNHWCIHIVQSMSVRAGQCPYPSISVAEHW